MDAHKSKFYQTAAKGFAASTILYRVKSVVHVEDNDDIWFWQQILSHYRPGKYKFRPGSLNEDGTFTTGCWQCLKYKDYLSQRFFICIDSDLRFLLGEELFADNGILQTYTYSWENHCCYAEKLQHDFAQLTGRGDVFDFRIFLKNYSEIIYEPFIYMLYCERNKVKYFDKERFKAIISLQFRKNDEENNGTILLERLKKNRDTIMNPFKEEVEWSLEDEENRYKKLGLYRQNAYLFVRGHSLYNLLKSIGNRLCDGTGVDFEQNILKANLAFDKYEAMEKIKRDVSILNSIKVKFTGDADKD